MGGIVNCCGGRCQVLLFLPMGGSPQLIQRSRTGSLSAREYGFWSLRHLKGENGHGRGENIIGASDVAKPTAIG